MMLFGLWVRADLRLFMVFGTSCLWWHGTKYLPEACFGHNKDTSRYL